MEAGPIAQLRDVTKENYQSCIALEVAQDQRGFIAPNIVTLAQAYIYRDTAKLFAIYAGDAPVGFAMLNLDAAKGEYWIWRFMIDRRFQRRGYGTDAFMQIIEYFRLAGAQRVKLSFMPGNRAAEALYTKCGFARTGDLHDDEIEMILIF